MQKADRKQPPAFHFWVAVSKEKGFSKVLIKSHEKSNKKPQNQANMWSTENSRFCEKYIEKQPKTSQNSLFSAVFLVEVAGLELAASSTRRVALLIFKWFLRLFGAF